jgi:hypothetical protein
MSNTLKIAPDLYSNPPKTAIPGARTEYRTISLATTDLITTQLVALAVLPAGHRWTGSVLESGSLDAHTTTTITCSVGILNTYYNQAAATSSVAADYNNATGRTESPGTDTDTNTDPQLVSNHNAFTASTVCRAGGRVYPSLAFTKSVGVDSKKDRIIAVQFPAAPATAQAGFLSLINTFDID